MSTHLYHFLTMVGNVAEDAMRELARFRALVIDPNDRNEVGDVSEFVYFCQSLLLTRFEPPVIHYSCYRNDYGIGNRGIRGFAEEACGDNAVRDTRWAATVYPHSCAEACLAIAKKQRDENAIYRDGYNYSWFQEMVTSAIGIGLRSRLPFATFLVTEQVGVLAEREEIAKVAAMSLDRLFARARENAVYLPSTARGMEDLGIAPG